MPSLEEILKKNNVSEKIKFVRKPLSIATEDRPYSLAETAQSNQIEVIKKLNTNLTQTRHKPNTNLTQTQHEIITKTINSTQTQHKLNTKPNTKKTQTQHKPNTNSTQTRHISIVIGVQRKILLFIFEECKKARSRITEPLSITHIANAMEIPTGSVKTSVARLCYKQFIRVNSFKNGRGGWSSYEIPDDVYNELLQMETQHKLNTNQTQTRHKLDTKPNTQPNTNPPSSSSDLNLLINTTTDLKEDWNFEIMPYSKFGFSVSHVKQLAKLGVISVAEVEQSLIEFNYDLDNDALPQIKTNKINFLMGLLRAGQSYVSEGYRNEQEAIISEMARRAEDKRKKLLEEQFLSWEATLSNEERKNIECEIPIRLKVLYRAHGISTTDTKNWLFNYFIQSTNGQ